MFYKVLLMVLLYVLPGFAKLDLNELKSFHAKFTQVVTNDSDKKVAYKGEVFIKNSGKVLWKYKEPIIKNVYIVDGVVIIDEPELEQVIYTNIEKEINIINLLKNAQEINKNLYKTKLSNIEYFIQVKNEKIKSLSYEDELQNKITIDFNEVSQNSEIDDELFRFLPPDYYDIIKK